MGVENKWVPLCPQWTNNLFEKTKHLLVEKEMFLLDVGGSRKGDIPNRCRLGGICDYTKKVMSSM